MEMKRSLLIYNIPVGVSEDDIHLYFQKSSSGGGDVKSVYHPLDGQKDQALVVFEENEVAERVNERGHMLKDQKIYTRMYIEPFPKIEASLDPAWVTEHGGECGVDEIVRKLRSDGFDVKYVEEDHVTKKHLAITGTFLDIAEAHTHLQKWSKKHFLMNKRSVHSLGNRTLGNDEYGNQGDQWEQLTNKHENEISDVIFTPESGSGEGTLSAPDESATTPDGKKEVQELQDEFQHMLPHLDVDMFAYLRKVKRNEIHRIETENNVLFKPEAVGVSMEADIHEHQGTARPDNASHQLWCLYNLEIQHVHKLFETFGNLDKQKLEKIIIDANTAHPNVYIEIRGFDHSEKGNQRHASTDTRIMLIGEKDDMHNTLETIKQQLHERHPRHFGNASHSIPERVLKKEFVKYSPGNGVTVLIYQADIVTMKTNVIVNAANEYLIHGGGVAEAIASAAGPKLVEASKKHVKNKGPLSVGDVTHTTSGILKCNNVLHAVGPKWGELDDEMCCAMLEKTFFNALEYANKKLEAQSIAIPAISSGIYGVPLPNVGQAMWDAVERYTKHITSVKSATLKEIHFVNNDKKTNDFLTIFFCKKLDPNEEYSFSEDENDTYHDASQDPPGSDRVTRFPRDSGKNHNTTNSVHTSHNRVSPSPSSCKYTNISHRGSIRNKCHICFQWDYLKQKQGCDHLVCRKCESKLCPTCTSTARYSAQQSFGNVNPTGMHAMYPMHNHF